MECVYYEPVTNTKFITDDYELRRKLRELEIMRLTNPDVSTRFDELLELLGINDSIEIGKRLGWPSYNIMGLINVMVHPDIDESTMKPILVIQYPKMPVYL